MPSITYDKFDGGMVDGYLDTETNRYFLADNLSVDENGNLQTRNGLSIYTNKVPSYISSNVTYQQLTGIYYFPNPFTKGLFVVGAKVYTGSTAAFAEISGFNSFTSLKGKEEGALEQGIFWRGQFIVCPNGNGYSVTTTGTQPQRIYCKTLNTTYQGVCLGLPRPSGTPAFAGGVGSNTYNYAFYWDYQFTDYQGTVFEEKGPLLTVAAPGTYADPGSSTIALTNLPTMTLNNNYDGAVITLKIFRTLAFGSTYYSVGSVTQGTTTFNDSVADTTLANATPIYTDGGVLEYVQPPSDSFYVTQVNDFFWYAGNNFITHSVPGAPGACPSLYHTFTDQKVRGLSDTIGFPILFCDKSVYRVEGTYDAFGNGGFTLREISATAGCMSSRAIVKVPGGLAWPGNGGFYFTDGYSVVPLSDYLPVRYQSWRNANMVGAFDSNKKICYWTVTSENAPKGGASASALNDTLVVWHVRYGIRPDAVFTTHSFKQNILPTTIFFTESLDVSSTYSSRLLLGDARGYFLYSDPLRYTDPLIDQTVFPSSFYDTVILWDFQSALEDAGDPATRRYSTHVSFECGTETPVALSIQFRRDDTGPWTLAPEARQDAGILWNISDVLWANDSIDYEWIGQRLLEGRRTAPSGQLRNQRRQLRFTNSSTNIYNSDTLGTATVTALSLPLNPYPTISLNNYPTQIWPDQPTEYFISFAGDAYTKQYKIRARISDQVISVFDPYQTLSAVGATKWQIAGNRKYERFNLLTYTVNFDVDGQTQTPGQPTAGGNA